jgi:hypothetical protein
MFYRYGEKLHFTFLEEKDKDYIGVQVLIFTFPDSSREYKVV